MRGWVRGAVFLVVCAGSVLVAARFWKHGEGSAAGARPAEPAAAGAKGGRRIRVEVLNAGGKRGAARDATELLRQSGFDVVYFGNADTFDQDSSVVLDRVGDLGAARSVADALGIHSVRSRPDPNLYLDVSVRLGSGWAAPAGGDRRRP